MDTGYLSILLTNNFRCVFRYYYGVNANTELILIILIDFMVSEKFFFKSFSPYKSVKANDPWDIYPV